MPYDHKLAERIREFLTNVPAIKIEEKKMFRGLAFLINGKMCVNVSGENLMCRFDPELQEEITGKIGYEPMIMRGRELKGYCYINPEGVKGKKALEYWINLCLDFNERAKASKKTSHMRKRGSR